LGDTGAIALSDVPTVSFKALNELALDLPVAGLVWTPDQNGESADARRILTAVPQSDWRRPVGRPHSSWMATLKNDLSLHNLTFEDAIKMDLDKPLWGLLAASGATH